MEGNFGFLKQFVLLMALRNTMHSNPRECTGVNWEVLQLLKFNVCFLLLQVSWEFISGISSHTYYIWVRNHMPYHRSVSYTEKHITRSLLLALLPVLHTHNNTDDNKLVIFSSTALCHYRFGKNFKSTHTSHRQVTNTRNEMLQLWLKFWTRGNYNSCKVICNPIFSSWLL